MQCPIHQASVVKNGLQKRMGVCQMFSSYHKFVTGLGELHRLGAMEVDVFPLLYLQDRRFQGPALPSTDEKVDFLEVFKQTKVDVHFNRFTASVLWLKRSPCTFH